VGDQPPASLGGILGEIDRKTAKFGNINKTNHSPWLFAGFWAAGGGKGAIRRWPFKVGWWEVSQMRVL
jgi:hypothetical protein